MKHRKMKKTLKISGIVILSFSLVIRMLSLPIDWWWRSAVFWCCIIGIIYLVESLRKPKKHNVEHLP